MSALLSAARGTLPAEPLLAFRYDESHMIVVLEDLSRYRREELEGLYDRDSPRQSWSGNEALGAPNGWLDADLDLWEQKFGPPPLGEARTVHLPAGRFASCRIDRIGVAALSGCQDGLVALCEIPPDEREGFAKATADHFVLTAPAPDPPARPEIETGAISPASLEERDAIARALDRLLPDSVSRVREEMESEYARTARGDPRVAQRRLLVRRELPARGRADRLRQLDRRDHGIIATGIHPRHRGRAQHGERRRGRARLRSE